MRLSAAKQAPLPVSYHAPEVRKNACHMIWSIFKSKLTQKLIRTDLPIINFPKTHTLVTWGHSVPNGLYFRFHISYRKWQKCLWFSIRVKNDSFMTKIDSCLFVLKLKKFRILEIISILTLNVILSGCTCIFLVSLSWWRYNTRYSLRFKVN